MVAFRTLTPSRLDNTRGGKAWKWRYASSQDKDEDDEDEVRRATSAVFAETAPFSCCITTYPDNLPGQKFDRSIEHTRKERKDPVLQVTDHFGRRYPERDRADGSL